MAWMIKLFDIAKATAGAAIDAITGSQTLGNFSDDPNGAAHLTAAQAAAVAAVGGLNGSATLCDVSISVNPDSSPAITGSYATGSQISIVVVEKY